MVRVKAMYKLTTIANYHYSNWKKTTRFCNTNTVPERLMPGHCSNLVKTDTISNSLMIDDVDFCKLGSLTKDNQCRLLR